MVQPCRLRATCCRVGGSPYPITFFICARPFPTIRGHFGSRNKPFNVKSIDIHGLKQPIAASDRGTAPINALGVWFGEAPRER